MKDVLSPDLFEGTEEHHHTRFWGRDSNCVPPE